jgi:hypothetical protein
MWQRPCKLAYKMPSGLQHIVENGHHRMGDPGAARQIALALHQLYREPD